MAEKCFIKTDSIASEPLKEFVDKNCQSIEKCGQDIKSAKSKFNQDFAKLAAFEENFDVLQVLVGERLDGNDFYSSLDPQAEFSNLDQIYGLADEFYTTGADIEIAEASFMGVITEEAAAEAATKASKDPSKIKNDASDKLRKFLNKINEIRENPEVVDDYVDSREDFLSAMESMYDIINVMDDVAGTAPDGQGRPGTGVGSCAQQLYVFRETHRSIAAEETGLAVTARGDFSDDSLEDRVAAAEQLAVESQADGVGSTISIESKIPREFKEQCAMLALIFKLASIHQGEQVGTDTIGSDPGDLVQNALRYEQTRKKLPYEAGGDGDNSTLLVDGQPYGFINKFTQYGSMIQFFEATNAQLAHLQPTIRLFKVFPGEKEEEEIEFRFDTFARETDVKSIFERKDKRGFGVGIQNFRFKYDGSNPFSIKKSIKASLSITANNFQELLDDSRGFRYIELALKTGKINKVEFQKSSDKRSELDFRIKAIVGLSLPDAKTTAGFDNIKRAVENNYVTLNLTPVTHTFDFDETGAVKFNIEYYAYIEEFFDKARMNIFADTEINKRVITRQLGIKTQKKNCSDEDSVKKLNEFIEKDGEQVKRDKIESLQFLTNELLNNNLIYYLNLSTEEFKKLSTLGPFFEFGDIKQKITVDGSITSDSINKDLEESYNAKTSDEEDKKSLQNSFKISGLDNRQIPFFFIGDLLDIILEKIGKNLENISNLPQVYSSPDGGSLDIDPELLLQEKAILINSKTQFKKFRLVLGPVEIINHKNPSEVRRCSISDIPVSLAYFNEWLTSKLLAKDSANYPLTQFVNDLINNLVRNFLNDDSCYNFNIKQKTRLFQSVITSYRQPGQDFDDITSKIYTSETDLFNRRLNIDGVSEDDKPVLNIGGHRYLGPSNLGPDRENHFFIFYAGRTAPPDLMQGDRDTDQNRGIFHYIMGRDRGIVKNIKLSKTNSPGLKEVRFEQEGYQGLYQLREIYDVNIDTLCNIHAFPGTYIFVEPRGFSPALGEFKREEFDLTDLGVGGYYMIISSEHEFGPGKMNTSITAKWVQSLDAAEESKQSQYSSTSGAGDSEVKKCGVR